MSITHLRLPAALLICVAGLAAATLSGSPAPARAQTVSATVSVCGTVSAYAAATATAPGSITLGGLSYPIAAACWRALTSWWSKPG